jgi:hypothetical protein
MQLLLYLGNDLIDSAPIRTDQLSEPGYLGRFKRVLKEKHAEEIKASGERPEFLVVKLDTTSASSSLQQS